MKEWLNNFLKEIDRIEEEVEQELENEAGGN